MRIIDYNDMLALRHPIWPKTWFQVPIPACQPPCTFPKLDNADMKWPFSKSSCGCSNLRYRGLKHWNWVEKEVKWQNMSLSVLIHHDSPIPPGFIDPIRGDTLRIQREISIKLGTPHLKYFKLSRRRFPRLRSTKGDRVTGKVALHDRQIDDDFRHRVLTSTARRTQHYRLRWSNHMATP